MVFCIICLMELIIVICFNVCIYVVFGFGKIFIFFIVDKLLLLDFDCGVYCLVNCKDIVQVECWEDVVYIIVDDLVDFNIVVVDIVGCVFDMLMLDIICCNLKMG